MDRQVLFHIKERIVPSSMLGVIPFISETLAHLTALPDFDEMPYQPLAEVDLNYPPQEVFPNPLLEVSQFNFGKVNIDNQTAMSNPAILEGHSSQQDSLEQSRLNDETFNTPLGSFSNSEEQTNDELNTPTLGQSSDPGSQPVYTPPIPVQNGNPPIALLEAPDIVKPTAEITLDATESFDLDGEIVRYQFDLGDGRQYIESIDDAPDGKFDGIYTFDGYDTEGIKKVTLTVFDDQGLSASVSQNINVINQKPVFLVPGTDTSGNYADKYYNPIDYPDPNAKTPWIEGTVDAVRNDGTQNSIENVVFKDQNWEAIANAYDPDGEISKYDFFIKDDSGLFVNITPDGDSEKSGIIDVNYADFKFTPGEEYTLKVIAYDDLNGTTESTSVFRVNADPVFVVPGTDSKGNYNDPNYPSAANPDPDKSTTLIEGSLDAVRNGADPLTKDNIIQVGENWEAIAKAIDIDGSIKSYEFYIKDDSGDFLLADADADSTTSGIISINYNYFAFTGGQEYTMKVIATDNNGGSTESFDSFVINRPPEALNDDTSTDYDQSVDIPVLDNDSDPDGDDLSIEDTSDPKYGVVITNPDGTITYDPNLPNNAPNLKNDSFTITENTPISLDVTANDTDADGQFLRIVSVGNPIFGTVQIVDNQILYTPELGFSGIETFTYTVTDGLTSASATVNLNVTSLNQSPIANDDLANTDLDTPITIDVLGNDSDPEMDAISISAFTQPSAGDIVLNPDNTFTYTPKPGFIGTDIFTYQITDGNGNLDLAKVTIQINAVNGAPNAVDDAVSTKQGSTVKVDVLSNDNDPDNDKLTISDFTQPSAGTVVINPDNTFSYTPNPSFTGTDTFTYEISDGNGGFDTANVTISVNAVPGAPDAIDDNVSTVESVPIKIDVLSNDINPDGGSLFVLQPLDQPDNGTVTINPDNTITYTPDDGFIGTDSFTYTILDSKGGFDTAEVIVEVTPGIPIAKDDLFTTDYQKQITIDVLANDIDPDGQKLSIDSYTDPSFGTLVKNPDDTFTYTPEAGFQDVVTFSYYVIDESGNKALAFVEITVEPEDLPPAINVDNLQFFQLGSYSSSFEFDVSDELPGEVKRIDVWVVDESGKLNYVESFKMDFLVDIDFAEYDSATNSWSSLQPISMNRLGDRLATLDLIQGEQYDIYFYAVDDSGQFTFDIETFVYGGDLPSPYPVGENDYIEVLKGEPIVIDLLDNDSSPGGYDLDVTYVGTSSAGSYNFIDDSTIEFFLNDPNFVGTITFAYQVYDFDSSNSEYLNYDFATVTIKVLPIGSPPTAEVIDPVLESDTNEVVKGDKFTIVSIGSDPDPGDEPQIYKYFIDYSDDSNWNPILVGTTGPGTTSSLEVDTSLFDFAPGKYEIVLRVFDSNNNDYNDFNNFFTIVEAPDNPPFVQVVDPVEESLTDEVVYGDSFTIYAIGSDPDPGDEPQYYFYWLVNSSDPTGEKLLIGATGAGTESYLEVDTLDFPSDKLTPGVYILQVATADKTGNTYLDLNAETIYITSSTNSPPIALNDKATVTSGDSIKVNVLTNDSDPDKDTVSIDPGGFTQPTNGTVTLNPDNTFTYESNPGFVGGDSFTYMVGDGNGGFDTATVYIVVNPLPNQDPIAANDIATVSSGGSVKIDVLANDTDPETDILEVYSFVQPSNGTVVLNGNDTFTYIADPGYSGSDSFTYVVSDGKGGFDTATVNIDVLSTSALDAKSDEASTKMNASIQIDVLANDIQNPGFSLDLDGVTQSHAGGTVTFDPITDMVTYTPKAGFYGLDAFTYTISDGSGNTDAALVYVLVSPTDTFDYTISDGRGGFDTASVTVDLLANLPVITQPDTQTTTTDTPINFNVLANDYDPESSTFEVSDVSTATFGSLSWDQLGNLTYTPNPGVVDVTDIFSYTVTDDFGNQTVGSVRIYVIA
ncbi:MAG: Ig-like domain-containing protein [Candidatus Caenarcaniphilales bacterium]|nr:Ig-like domain-containing protein [Candidatus Caenarcaniphilales bacterium]